MIFTQNPIGSSATEDLQDNAISFDYAMNSPAALWEDRFGKQHKTVQQALKDVGFKPAGFDFVTGGTLGIGDRDKCVFYPTDGYWYSWNGKLPYTIPANSSPTPGGSKGWKLIIKDDTIIAREALRRTYLEVGLNLVEGSFEEGGTLQTSTDVLLEEKGGKVYIWDGEFPVGGKIIPPSSTPNMPSGYGIWKECSNDSLRAFLQTPNGPNIINFDMTSDYLPGTIGYRLSNSIDITDAPYNARPNKKDIAPALLAAISTGRPVYFPEPKNPSDFYLISGTLLNLANTILHGPVGARLVFDGVEQGGKHIHARGKYTHVFGLTLESISRGSIIRAEPKDPDGIEEVRCVGTKFKGGFYSVRAGDSLELGLGFPTKRVSIIDCQSEAPRGQNAGHFFSYGVDLVRYLHTSVMYGKNTAAYGAAFCKKILIDGCSEEGVEQTSSGVEAAAQIEDSEKCSGKIVNCSFEHDIWVASSSGVKVHGNTCRELRVSTGSRHTNSEMKDILFLGNTAARINVQKYGSYNNEQRCNVDFVGNTLDPVSYLNLGTPYTSSYVLQGSVCRLIRLKDNKNISDASTSAIQLTRDPELRLEIDNFCRFGSKQHVISNSGGKILSGMGLDKSVPGQGTTQVADILLGCSTPLTPTAVGNFTNIPFSNVAKNTNLEYVNNGIVPIEDCVFQITGAITIDSPVDGVRFSIQIFNETENFVLVSLGDVKLWAGVSTIQLGAITVKLLAGKTYRLRYVTGNSGCVISTGIANTWVGLKGLI